MLVIWLGALLVIAGIVLLAGKAIWRGSMSKSNTSRTEPAGTTLEPPRRGLGFLGLGSNWPGLVLMVVGGLLLLAGGFF